MLGDSPSSSPPTRHAPAGPALAAAAMADRVHAMVARSHSLSQQARNDVVNQANRWLHGAVACTAEMRRAADSLPASRVDASQLVQVLQALERDVQALQSKYAAVMPGRAGARVADTDRAVVVPAVPPDPRAAGAPRQHDIPDRSPDTDTQPVRPQPRQRVRRAATAVSGPHHAVTTPALTLSASAATLDLAATHATHPRLRDGDDLRPVDYPDGPIARALRGSVARVGPSVFAQDPRLGPAPLSPPPPPPPSIIYPFTPSTSNVAPPSADLPTPQLSPGVVPMPLFSPGMPASLFSPAPVISTLDPTIPALFGPPPAAALSTGALHPPKPALAPLHPSTTTTTAASAPPSGPLASLPATTLIALARDPLGALLLSPTSPFVVTGDRRDGVRLPTVCTALGLPVNAQTTASLAWDVALLASIGVHHPVSARMCRACEGIYSTKRTCCTECVESGEGWKIFVVGLRRRRRREGENENDEVVSARRRLSDGGAVA
ncbi:hypothetical protein GGF32_001184 [Allomyces javanicus]|nr:hypothetical protein GGF32_001184 [Allomyces javanicus]